MPDRLFANEMLAGHKDTAEANKNLKSEFVEVCGSSC
jgi:hypothetical protein